MGTTKMKKEEIIVLLQDIYNKIPEGMKDQLEGQIPVMRDHLPILHDYLIIKDAIAFSQYIMNKQEGEIKQLKEIARKLAERAGTTPPAYDE